MFFFRHRTSRGYTQLLKLLTAGAVRVKKAPVKVTFSLASVISTWFYIGRVPIAPGTLGALATYPIYIFCIYSSTSLEEMRWTFGACAVIIAGVAIWSIAHFQRDIGIIDHQCIVVDEVIGQLITFALALSWLYNLSLYASPIFSWSIEATIFFLGVLFFRYFDITKPFIIAAIDKHMKNAIGVILDDIVAALFASGAIYIIAKIMHKLSGFNIERFF